MAEYVCLDGRMSVNGICPASSYPGYQEPTEDVVTTPVIDTNQNYQNNKDSDRDTNIPTKTFDQKYESIEDIPKPGYKIRDQLKRDFLEGGLVKDFSKSVKSTFEWDFDKVGNKVQNFGSTIKGNINAYDNYVEDNLGIPKGVAYGARTLGVGAGISAYGAVGAALPFLIPFMAGGALNSKQKKENERITQATMNDTQGSDNTIDMATYGIPTAGETGFNIHNDSYDSGNNNNNNQSTGGGASYDNAASTGAKDGFGYGL